jgi:large subunit ribosomal protein L2
VLATAALSCRGGGSKRRLRAVDFVRQRDGVEGVVERLEYDPNRTGYIALVKYPPGGTGACAC